MPSHTAYTPIVTKRISTFFKGSVFLMKRAGPWLAMGPLVVAIRLK